MALNINRQLDECRQRALSRGYLASLVGGLAVGVHTTQFHIHDSKAGLLKPVWVLASEEMGRADIWCLDGDEDLSPGQAAELDRIEAAYPDLVDNDFVAEHREVWMSG